MCDRLVYDERAIIPRDPWNAGPPDAPGIRTRPALLAHAAKAGLVLAENNLRHGEASQR